MQIFIFYSKMLTIEESEYVNAEESVFYSVLENLESNIQIRSC